MDLVVLFGCSPSKNGAGLVVWLVVSMLVAWLLGLWLLYRLVGDLIVWLVGW